MELRLSLAEEGAGEGVLTTRGMPLSHPVFQIFGRSLECPAREEMQTHVDPGRRSPVP